jgi:hypothetical protein
MTSTTPRTSPAPNGPRAMPSVHRRAALTWLAAYPANNAGSVRSEPLHRRLAADGTDVRRHGVAVPLSVYVLVPRLMRLAGGIHRRQH